MEGDGKRPDQGRCALALYLQTQCAIALLEVQATANGRRELAEVYEFCCSSDLPLIEPSAHPGYTFKRQFIIMKIAYDRQTSVEPGSVWLVEIGRTDVLGPAESVPIAYGQI